MFALLGRASFRYRRWFLIGTALVVVFAGVWGTGVFGALAGDGFEDTRSESYRAAKAAQTVLGGRGADVVLLVEHPDLTVADPAFRQAVQDVVGTLPAADVDMVATYWTTKSPTMVSRDQHATYAAIRFAGDSSQAADTYDRLAGKVRAPAGFTVTKGGRVPLNQDINNQVSKDIAQAEMLSFPVLLILLVVVFGGLVAAGLPLAVGGVAILGAFTVLRVITGFTEVSVFAINIVTMLGLGLAIDYALFVVSRFREELRAGRDVEQALVATMSTAGRTVAVSGVTVAVSLSSLLLFPQVFFRSMGLGGIAAVGVAMLAALTALPALLAVLGRRVDALRLPGLRRREGAAEGHGAWYRIARSVMRRPILYVAVIVPVLLLAGSPFLRVQFGGVDHRALPNGVESREVAERLVADFPGGGEKIRVVVEGATPAALERYVGSLKSLDGVRGAAVAGVSGNRAVVDVAHDLDAYSSPARSLVAHVRDLPAPAGATVTVGGETANLVDLLHGIGAKLPWMALWVFSVTFVLLFLAFGSLLLPLKAIVMNLLSLTASFGALVWIFQDGNLSGVLHFTSTGTVEATQPILILAMAFGLSMDYEVFLLSRIREQWDTGGDNALAVATGLQRTGGIITSAAVLLIVVIGAFATGGITVIKMIGVGMLVAIVIDATIVRALLVPATMRLLGPANWWLPGPLERVWRRFGIRESEAAPEAAPELVPSR
ncbi:MMPL family transporter [Planosporangium flavigriseum]|uniref:Membrane protein n=1 Tax=Planosporangium flavigriseum TaxID=373681 RepID=A0A8J3LVF5_9ACTN|nr:MMPL family transporter [Planosporangium flavigriseum]NJC64202.1 MMPL family transporter [Planosporangium flavigriseum]GIG74316.1 membrane protein [Planosporangium flavigriseum]